LDQLISASVHYNDAKAGVMLLELTDEAQEQQEFDLDGEPEDCSMLMAAIDRLNEPLRQKGGHDGKCWGQKEG